jgi:hypothetical protein
MTQEIQADSQLLCCTHRLLPKASNLRLNEGLDERQHLIEALIRETVSAHPPLVVPSVPFRHCAEVLTRNRDPVLQDNSRKERILLGKPFVCAVVYVVPLKRRSSKH